MAEADGGKGLGSMRIAINAAFLQQRSEGLATYARSVIDELSRSGHETFVYTSERMEWGGNGHTKWRPTPSSLRAGAGTAGEILRAMVWSQTALPLRLLRDRAQALLCTLPEGMLVPVCPQAVVVHDLFPLFFPELYPRWKYYFRHVLPRLLSASDAVIAASNHTKSDLVSHLGVAEEKIAVVHNWLDPVFFSNDPGRAPAGFDPGPFFLYVGRLSPYKNLEMVMRAFAEVRYEVRERLVCVFGFLNPGSSGYYSEILDLAERLGIRERLRIYSGVSPAEILFLYRNATALVLLSKYEGFGYPPLEAMALGTPAIVSDSTALAEVAGPGAVCVANTEPGPAAEAMRRLALDSGCRAAAACKGREHARQFSRERGGRRIRSVIESCAGAGKSATAI